MTFAVSRIYGRASAAIGTDNPRLVVAAYLVHSCGYSIDHLVQIFGSTPYAPPNLDGEEKQLLDEFYTSGSSISESVWHEVPVWLHSVCEESLCPDAQQELAALLVRAPVDLRVNKLKASRDDVLLKITDSGHECVPTPYSPLGIRIVEHVRLAGWDLYESGVVEVQDEASQVAALLVGAKPGERVIDYCAGAGGKSLVLATQMQGKGEVIAFDVSAKRLAPLAERAKRSGVGNIRSLVLGSKEADAAILSVTGTVDRILVDAPCSGSGTWRRSPDAKWLLTPAKLRDYQDQQFEVVNRALELLKPGGQLVYVTCSFLKSENETVVERVLNGNNHITHVDPARSWREITGTDLSKEMSRTQCGIRFSPYRTGTDGFYVHVLLRNS